MACDGPNKKFSDSQGEQAYIEVMEWLRAKYHIIGSENAPKYGAFKECYEKAEVALKESLKELLWEDNCSTW